MAFFDRLLLNYFINIRVHDIVPEGRKESYQGALEKIEREARHLLCKLQCCEYLVGVHVVIRMPLKSEDDPIMKNIFFGIP